MRRRLALLGACLTAACAGAPARLRLPEPTIELERAPPPHPAPPREGPFDALESRWLRLVVVAGHDTVTLEGWCRVGVWTTLAETRGRTFVVRQSWGRLGERRPRRLARIEDQALEGVVARLRPEADGAISFDVEIADVRRGRGETVDIYHGERITFRRPRRHGYRFRGRVPADHTGWAAHWRGEAAVAFGEAPRQRPGRIDIAGGAARLETFVEEWVLAAPITVAADGIERKDYRLVKRRRAAGFVRDAQGRLESYGADLPLP